MWRLQHRQFVVVQKPANRDLQERSRGDVIAVEDCDKLAPGLTQSVVQIAGFSPGVLRACYVAHAGLRCELAKLAARSVVQQDYV